MKNTPRRLSSKAGYHLPHAPRPNSINFHLTIPSNILIQIHYNGHARPHPLLRPLLRPTRSAIYPAASRSYLQKLIQYFTVYIRPIQIMVPQHPQDPSSPQLQEHPLHPKFPLLHRHKTPLYKPRPTTQQRSIRLHPTCNNQQGIGVSHPEPARRHKRLPPDRTAP